MQRLPAAQLPACAALCCLLLCAACSGLPCRAAPWYNTYAAHYKEAECFRLAVEELLYDAGADMIFAGQLPLCSAAYLACPQLSAWPAFIVCLAWA